MNRSVLIRNAIQNLNGQTFEQFAILLLSGRVFPGLVPTSVNYDLGEDGRTCLSTAFLHGGVMISVAASTDASYNKVSSDGNRCRETGRRIDRFIFATSEHITRYRQEENYSGRFREEFGWDLEIWTLEMLSNEAMREEHARLVDEFLRVPPPGQDFINDIEEAFQNETNSAVNQVRLTVTGIDAAIEREEVTTILETLGTERPVLLIGEAGTGKSGIAAMLALHAREQGRFALFINSSRLSTVVRTETDLRNFFNLAGPVSTAVERLGYLRGCRLIVDQLDDVINLPAGERLIDLLIRCRTFSNVEVIGISRVPRDNNPRLIEMLYQVGFTTVECSALPRRRVQDLLVQMGIQDPADALISLGTNLLNLSIIGAIKTSSPNYDFTAVLGRVELWEGYVDEIARRERDGGAILAKAIELAQESLNSADRILTIRMPIPHPVSRLISWNILTQVNPRGRLYQFQHERLAEFFYAFDAYQVRKSPREIEAELPIYRTAPIFDLMSTLYEQHDPAYHVQFLEEVLLNG